jgi:hypothetical protein
MDFFKQMGLLPVQASSRSSTNNEMLKFSIRKDSSGRKTMVFNFSPILISQLNWENVERIDLQTDEKQLFGIAPLLSDKDNISAGYKLIKSSKSGFRREIKLTWQEHVCYEPQINDQFDVQYEIKTENGVSGILFTLPLTEKKGENNV